MPTLALGAGSAFAYGRADEPLAQIEISGNCDNASFWLCQPDAVGTGGIWVWIEVDANGTADAAGAVCGHTIGGPRGFAGSIRGEYDWSYVTADQLPPGPPLLITDPGGKYYWIPDVFDQPIPVTQGHYSFHPAPGVSLQIQVAP